MKNTFYLTDSLQSKKISLPKSQQQKFTIGRTPQNSLQILDTTVSKNHALIYLFAHQMKYVLQDLGSINGTYVNGNQIINSKIYLNHNDKIQFGKCQQFYIFKIAYPQPEKKGKINLKDYHFELQDDFDVKPVLLNKRNEIANQNISIQTKTKSNWNDINKITGQFESQKKGKQRFERAIKIPKFEQFLELQGQQIQTKSQGASKIQWNNAEPVKKWNKNEASQAKNQLSQVSKQKVRLPDLNRKQLSEEDKINKIMMQRKRQLQRAQKEAMLRKTQQQQKLLQQKLRLEIQRGKQQQELLRQKYQTEKRSEEEQKRLLKQKLLLQEKIRLQEKELKQRQSLLQQQLKQKQQNLLQELNRSKQSQMLMLKEKQFQLKQKLQEQKNKQIQSFKVLEDKKREQKENVIKRQVEDKKKQLQLEAQALTKQYENIYKQTIKKMQLNIQTEQNKIFQIDNQIQKINRQIQELYQTFQVQHQSQKQLELQFNQINGRNKAFLLYASHLQTKIDNLKLQNQKTNIKDPTKNSLQLKDSILQCRKLLNMKLNQRTQLERQIKQHFVNLNITSSSSEQYLTTILQNYQQIQRLKQIYFLYFQEQKNIQNKWDLQLEQNNILEQKVRNIKKQLQSNKKKLSQNLNDNLKKLTEQRLHMLKMMYYVSEQKKSAAKFLVEEMLTIQQQNKAINLDSENVHTKITNLIVQMQDKKRQNEELSSLLFGADSTSHHFDNMKEQINQLIESIETEKDDYRIENLLKTSSSLIELENKIFLQCKRQKKVKQELKNNGHVLPALNTEKNPLVFFGKLLTKKQSELHTAEDQQSSLEKQLIQSRARVSALTQKKSKMNRLLQQFKLRQLRNVKDLLR